MKRYNCGQIIAPDDAFSLSWFYRYIKRPEFENPLCFSQSDVGIKMFRGEDN